MVFQWLLVCCKITKFQEVNFKILAQILATPKILAMVKNQDNIHWCMWCGAEGTLEHIILCCPETIAIHSFWKKFSKLPTIMQESQWIFGLESSGLNPLIWLCNFSVYKAHLCACNRNYPDIKNLLLTDAKCYGPLFPMVQRLNFSSVF